MADKKKQKSSLPENGGEDKSDDAPIVIKKYANRRLYNTATSSYVTLDYLSRMVRDGQVFVVFDAKTGDDITRSVLAQIIFEAESKGENMLPVDFLRQLIGFYGDSLQSAVPQYLSMSMERFARDQERMRQMLMPQFGAAMPTNPFEEMARQNVAMFERMFQMFSPFGQQDEDQAQAEEQQEAAAPEDDDENSIDDLKAELAEMKKRLDKLSND
ncbi:MAG: polyhydroxyalkanoate synthesis repressor PhaR [Alphaproteobacteria bacterium]